MKIITSLLIILGAAVLGSIVMAQEWPGEVGKSLGLPTTTDGLLEVRIWMGGGVGHPFQMTRFLETESSTVVEEYMWDTRGQQPRFSNREWRERWRWRRIYRSWCDGRPNHSGGYTFCLWNRVEIHDGGKLLRSLKPDLLWQLLSQDSLGDSECLVEDGTTVGIELIKGDRRRLVSYNNPDHCCPWPECDVALNAWHLAEAAY